MSFSAESIARVRPECPKKNESSKDPEIKMRVGRLLSKLNAGALRNMFSRKATFKGVGDDPERSLVWPCIMEIKEFDDKTGKFKGQIEWTNLNALNEIEGAIAVDKLVFKETKHIRRGNSIVGCVYTFDLKDDPNKQGKKIRGKWIDPSMEYYLSGSGKRTEVILNVLIHL
ncbi:MAG: hypothetical protein WCP55_15680 [Lentisphaerota bacterium]